MKADEVRDKVVVLSWHVDYWNRLGWKDSFSDKAYTARQKAYIPKLGTRGLVTPQILVANARVTKEWGEKITAEGAKPARVTVTAELELSPGKLAAEIRLAEPTLKLPPTAVVRAVLFQKEAVTKVTAGENAGKMLKEFFVVRQALDPIAAVIALEGPVKIEFALPKDVKTMNLGLAVLVEDPKKMTTLEAAVYDLPDEPDEPVDEPDELRDEGVDQGE